MAITYKEFDRRFKIANHGKDIIYHGYNNITSPLGLVCAKCDYKWEISSARNTLKPSFSCPECNKDILRRKFSMGKEEFIERSLNKHGGVYDYGEVTYVNSITKVTIFCKKCKNYFLQTPITHLKGCGCLGCSGKESPSLEQVKQLIKDKYNNFYGLEYLNDYKNCKSPLTLVCPKHGKFETNLDKIKNTKGVNVGACQRCSRKKLTSEDLVNEFKVIHSDKFDYSEFVYNGMRTKSNIMCKQCKNYFLQTPYKHLRGHGCINCKNYQNGNLVTYQVLKNTKPNGVKLIREKTFDDLLSPRGGKLRYDFCLMYNNKIFLIEVNGKQHYEDVPFFHRNGNSLEYQKEKDNLKVEYAKNNDMILFVIDYSHGDKLKLGKQIGQLVKQIF